MRNAYLSRIMNVKVPYSNIKADISKILKKNEYIEDFKVVDEENNKKSILLTLNNVRTTKYVPTLRRISRP
ncbi:MAG: 30S ribosomal protein S8 [Candidatus Peribacteria bacterium]|nr:30S ribosomal protein S8 [Candidatus Peribacteria bacterium]